MLVGNGRLSQPSNSSPVFASIDPSAPAHRQLPVRAASCGRPASRVRLEFNLKCGADQIPAGSSGTRRHRNHTDVWSVLSASARCKMSLEANSLLVRDGEVEEFARCSCRASCGVSSVCSLRGRPRTCNLRREFVRHFHRLLYLAGGNATHRVAARARAMNKARMRNALVVPHSNFTRALCSSFSTFATASKFLFVSASDFPSGATSRSCSNIRRAELLIIQTPRGRDSGRC